MALEVATAGANLFVQIAEFLPSILCKISDWNLARKDIKRDIQSFETDLKFLQNKLQLIQREFSITRETLTADLTISLNYCRTKCNELKDSLTDVRKNTKKVTLFPSNHANRLCALDTRRSALVRSLSELKDACETYVRQHQKKSIQMVPLPDTDLYFDFNFSTPENRLRELIQSPNFTSGSVVGAVAKRMGRTPVVQGPGGVGKTQTVCRIAHLSQTKDRYPDGILFTKLGAEATPTTLINGIAEFMFEIGDHEKARQVREITEIEKAVQVASTAFESLCLLFIFDDVWPVNGIPVGIITILEKIARHPHSKVVYTTRDNRLLGGQLVHFGDRRSEYDSEQILLTSSGLDRPKEEANKKAFLSIVNTCKGLPIALSLAGKAIRRLSEDDYLVDRESVWRTYNIDWDDPNTGVMVQVVIKAINVLSDQFGKEYWAYFKALCILQKAEQIPVFMLQRLWWKSEAECLRIIKTFQRFSVIRLGNQFKSSSELTVGLHDIILDICRRFALRDSSFNMSHHRVISSYCPDIGMSQVIDADGDCLKLIRNTMENFRQWWLRVSDDKFIFANIIRYLEASARFEDVIWLINRPKWLVNQLKTNKLHRVRQDLDSASRCMTTWIEDERSEMTCWINTVYHALNESYTYVKKSKWDGMIWTQLYGRLLYFEKKAPYVSSFLSEIVQQSPRPWLKPSYGALNPPSSLKERFNINGDYLCHTEDDDEMKVLVKRDGGVYLCRFNLKDGSQLPTSQICQLEDHARPICGVYDSVHSTFFVGLCNGAILELRNSATINTTDDLASSATVEHVMSAFRIFPPWQSTYHHGHLMSVNDLAVTADGNCLVSGSDDDDVYVWQWDGEIWISEKLEGHGDTVESVAVTQDGSMIVSGSADETVRIWQKTDGEWADIVLNDHYKTVTSVAVTKSGSRIVSGSLDDTVRIWEKDEEGEWQGQILYGHDYSVMTVGITDDGKHLVSGSRDKTIRVWEKFEDGLWESDTLTVQEWVCSVALTNDGSRVVSGSDDQSVCVWEKRGNTWEHNICSDHDNQVWCVATRPVSADMVATGSSDHTVHLWRGCDDQWVHQAVLTGQSSTVQSVAISRDGSTVVSGRASGAVVVWQKENDCSEWFSSVVTHHNDEVHSVAVAAKGDMVVSGSDDKTVGIATYCPSSEEWKSQTLQGHDDYVRTVDLSDDENTIRSEDWNGRTMFWTKSNPSFTWEKCESLPGTAIFELKNDSSGLSWKDKDALHREARTAAHVNTSYPVRNGLIVFFHIQPYIAFFNILN